MRLGRHHGRTPERQSARDALAGLFLEQVFSWGSDRDLMPLGIGIAAVILALSYFIGRRPEK
jgi:hypothetical protein